MAVETDADRLALLSTDDFGTDATIGSATVKGIFDNNYEAINIATGEITTTGPRFLCRTSDVTSVVQGTIVTINSIDYKAINIEPDGTGMTTIQLSKDTG